MEERYIIDPMFAHDAAAYLFWTLVGDVGISEATRLVVESEGLHLLDQPFTKQVMERYGIDKLSPALRLAFSNAVAAEAMEYRSAGRALAGIVYAEDASTGRSPEIKDLSTAGVKAIPRSMRGNENIPKVGSLCLRYPLPAVVFSNAMIEEEFIEVCDTSKALGFQMSLFLIVAGCQLVADHLYAANGYLQIPVPDRARGNLWDRIIPNSSRHVGSIRFRGHSSSVVVDITW